jgi:hypothetical protein
MPWLRPLVAGLSPQRPVFAWFSPCGFVVDKVALGQVFLPSSSVFPVIILQWLSILIYYVVGEQ